MKKVLGVIIGLVMFLVVGLIAISIIAIKTYDISEETMKGYPVTGQSSSTDQNENDTDLADVSETSDIVPDNEVIQEENNGMLVSEVTAYYKLTEKEKAVYDLLNEGIANHMAQIEIEPAVEISILEKSMTCLYMDHPEYYWYDNQYTYWTSGVTGLIEQVDPIYIISEAEAAVYDMQIQAYAESIIYGISADVSDYEKVKHVYESIVYNTEYVDGCQYNQSMASVFLNDEAVCAGYAKAMQYLLHEMDIPCTYVNGMATSSDGKTEAHAWNIVDLGGRYYYIDPTWGDPLATSDGSKVEIEWGYLCCSSQVIDRSHVMDIPVTMPACTSEDLNYYRLNNMYYEYFDRNQINSKLIEMTQNSEEKIGFAFGSEVEYQKMMTELFDNNLADEAGNIWANMHNSNSWQWSVSYNEQLYYIEFRWVS